MPTSAKSYNPHETEAKIYRRWERAKAFTPSVTPRRGRKPFVIVIPPPNITGSLHMGHALQATFMDALTRYHRMQGDDVLWVPGTDHAGIATQNVVEKELRKEGKTRHDLGREKFVERVWAWKERYGGIITQQLRQLGCSCDWTKERFTLDSNYTRAVQEAFIHYARKGLIYRGERIVNWCPRCASAISDLEVAHQEEEVTLYTIQYGPLALATVRPETKFGDTGVAVHPKDPRYQQYVGQEIEIETVIGPARIRVVADAAVDPTFGTGVVKVTPAHDFMDFEIGERHGLPLRQVIGTDGRMNEHAGPFAGMTAQEARVAVVKALKDKGLLVKEEPYHHAVATCSRCGATIEPLVSKQWFVKMAPLAKPAVAVAGKNVIRFTPERWRKTYLDWLRGVKDWCISRQLWWGHRIPAWYCHAGMRQLTRNQKPGTVDTFHVGSQKFSTAGSGEHIVISAVKPSSCPECGSKEFQPDPDVLDTWFSSALWPFAVFGWPEATADLKRFYPTAVLTTAREILQLWVARMVFSGLEFMNRKTYLPARQYGKTNVAQQIPFRDVIIHQTVLNLKGQRMSKSLGTGVDPMELIEQYGADATRFGLLIQTQRDQQSMRFDENAVRTGRNVVNKLWNLARFLEGHGAPHPLGTESLAGTRGQGATGRGRRRYQAPSPKPQAPTSFDQWILGRLFAVTREVTDALEEFRFGDAMRTLHAFLWDDFADWYVEVSKVDGMATPAIGREVFATLLRLLHPFLPFVTEDLWRRFRDDEGLLIVSEWPTADGENAKYGIRKASARGAPPRIPHPSSLIPQIQEIVRSLRSARALLGIPPARKLRVRLGGASSVVSSVPAIAFLAGCQDVASGDGGADWVPLSLRGKVRVALHRDALNDVDLEGRLAAAEKRVADLQAKIRDAERRLTVMRKGAPPEAVAAAEETLAKQRADLSEHEKSVATLARILAQI